MKIKLKRDHSKTTIDEIGTELAFDSGMMDAILQQFLQVDLGHLISSASLLEFGVLA
jgi:hypothetical protein